ncbi:MAG TPA: TolC family protein [Verrucomicrobiae bacterium]|nr:TolC family protein [Verrucomicrobiae bacterium]
MKPSIPTWFVAIATLGSCVATAARGANATNVLQALTLNECIVRALENNLEIKFDRINPTIQSWGVVGAQSVYDPTFTGTVSYQDSTTPLDPEQATALGLLSLDQQLLDSSVNLGGKLPTGATYDFFGSNSRSSGQLTSNFVFTGSSGVSLTQPILKNFGLGINSANIRIARKNQTIAQQNFVQLVMNKVGAVCTAYYELVFAIEDHKAKVETLDEAKELLDQTRKRVQIGVQSPLDVIQAEAGVAENEQAVITSAQLIKDNENSLKRLISQQVTEYRGVTLMPMGFPVAQAMDLEVTLSIRTALEMRPDYASAKEALERQNITVQFNRNQLWPEIDLQGSYAANGRGLTFSEFSDNVWSGDNPTWSGGIVVTIPLGNRQARANYHIAKLDADQALLTLKALEQDIIVQVENAVGHVGSSAKSVEAAHAATRAAEASLDAEKKKLLAGTSTTFLVLQAQAQLGSARSVEVRARASYSESLVALDLAEGTILQKNNIVLAESKP